MGTLADVNPGLRRYQEFRHRTYVWQLQQLAATLRETPMSVRQLAKKFEIIPGTMYARVRDLEKYGFKLEVSRVRVAKRGPLAEVFRVVD